MSSVVSYDHHTFNHGGKRVSDQPKPKFEDWAKTLSLSELMETRAIINVKVDELQNTIAAPLCRLKDRAALVDVLMQAEMNKIGAQTFTSQSGANIHWRRSMKHSLGDPVACYSYLSQRLRNGEDPVNVFSAFQKRLTAEFVEQYMEANDGMAPPGVNVFPERQLIFKAGNKTA